MAKTATVPIYSAHKALALALAGHVPVTNLEIEGNIVAWFPRTPQFDADCSKYDSLRPLFVGAKKLGESISLDEFLAAVQKARKQ